MHKEDQQPHKRILLMMVLVLVVQDSCPDNVDQLLLYVVWSMLVKQVWVPKLPLLV